MAFQDPRVLIDWVVQSDRIEDFNFGKLSTITHRFQIPKLIYFDTFFTPTAEFLSHWTLSCIAQPPSRLLSYWDLRSHTASHDPTRWWSSNTISVLRFPSPEYPFASRPLRSSQQQKHLGVGWPPWWTLCPPKNDTDPFGVLSGLWKQSDITAFVPGGWAPHFYMFCEPPPFDANRGGGQSSNPGNSVKGFSGHHCERMSQLSEYEMTVELPFSFINQLSHWFWSIDLCFPFKKSNQIKTK